MTDELSSFVRDKRMVVHLGAHKTATTYMQSILNAHRAELAGRGAALLLRKDLRRAGIRLRQKINKPAQDAEGVATPDLAALLAKTAAMPDTDHIILSEENLIGSTGNNLTHRSLYPGLTRKLKVLPKALNHPNVTFMLGVRDYGSFFSSNVTTAVRRGSIFDQDALRTALLVPGRRWVDVVADLRDVFPRARVTLWQHEDFAKVEARLFDTIAPGLSPAPQDRRFRTLSRDAMQDIVGRLSADLTDTQNRQIVRDAVLRFPLSAENPPFSLWSEEEAAYLNERYQADWQVLKSRYPESVLG